MAFDKLVFEEHFDGDTLNRDIWDYEIGFIRNHEPQYYTDRPCNIYLKDSMLHIVTLREDYEGAKYTSASINTMGRMHGDAQFAGSSSVPAHVEMMGFLGAGNNPMVGMTVACAVAVAESQK